VARDPEYLGSITQIMDFAGIPRTSFYCNGYADHLKKSAYLFSRPGRYGKTIHWSYKRLILVWLAEIQEKKMIPNSPIKRP
jgi:hypothetical protein